MATLLRLSTIHAAQTPTLEIHLILLQLLLPHTFHLDLNPCRALRHTTQFVVVFDWHLLHVQPRSLEQVVDAVRRWKMQRTNV